MSEVELKKELKELEFKYNQLEEKVSFRFNKSGEYKLDLKFTDLEGNEYIKEPTFIINDFKSNQIISKTQQLNFFEENLTQLSIIKQEGINKYETEKENKEKIEKK